MTNSGEMFTNSAGEKRKIIPPPPSAPRLIKLGEALVVVQDAKPAVQEAPDIEDAISYAKLEPVPPTYKV